MFLTNSFTEPALTIAQICRCRWRIYIAGDTEDVPEMRTLPDIDLAFIPMNRPFTMYDTNAAAIVRAFRPRVVYPYHYSPSTPTANLNLFKSQIGTDLGIEVRLRKWY